jgi:Protein of unknown function (DUF1552)
VKPFRLSRRFALQSAVATIALPRLDAMLDGNGLAYAENGMPLPKRYGLFYWGLGNDPARWTPDKTGPGYDLKAQLKPFEPVQEYVSVVTGMKCQPPAGRGQVHVGGSAAILTGDGCNNDAFQTATVSRESFDQTLVKHLGRGAKLDSIEVRSTASLHSPAEGGTVIDWVSHKGPGAPNKAEFDAAVVFDRLFGAGIGDPNASAKEQANIRKARKSVLDLVRKDAARLSKRVGAADRQRLELHLGGIRSIEQQLDSVMPPPPSACKAPTKTSINSPDSVKVRNKVMADLLTMAFACDLTRVGIHQFSGGGTHNQFHDVDVRKDVHEVGHTDGVTDELNRAYVFWMECFSTWLQAMKAVPEGAGNLLDNCCVFGTSDHGYAPQHLYTEFPLLVAGKAQGALRSGVHVRIVDGLATRVPLTIMKALGMNISTWGQDSLKADKVVAELLT